MESPSKSNSVNLLRRNLYEIEDHDFDSQRPVAEVPVKSKRLMCPRCRRPMKVCWCQFLPSMKIKIRTVIYILQHPHEESRCLQTAAMLVEAFEESHCILMKGKHFSAVKYPDLHEVASRENSLLLFPSSASIDLQDFIDGRSAPPSAGKEGSTRPALGPVFNLFVLDGTWSHAKGIYFQNKFLHNMTQVKLNNVGLSKYTIRTQPTDAGLSTVESVAFAVRILEDRPVVYEMLMKPLEALCRFQLQNGAVVHHSKEHLLKMGLQYPPKNKGPNYKSFRCADSDGTTNDDVRTEISSAQSNE